MRRRQPASGSRAIAKRRPRRDVQQRPFHTTHIPKPWSSNALRRARRSLINTGAGEACCAQGVNTPARSSFHREYPLEGRVAVGLAEGDELVAKDLEACLSHEPGVR